MIRILLVTILFFSAHQASAIVGVGVLGGMKSFKYDADGSDSDVDMSGMSVTLHGHFNLPMLPIGLGVFGGVESGSGEKAPSKITMNNQIAGLDFVVRAPLPKFKPFLNVGYLLMGNSEAEYKVDTTIPVEYGGGTTSTTTDGKVSGYRIGLGVEWSVLPLVSLVLQYSLVNEEFEYKKLKVKTAAGASTTVSLNEAEKIKVNGSVIGLGVNVSI